MIRKNGAIKKGWVYSSKKHDVLTLHYAKRENEKGLQIMFEDKVLYDNEENKALLKIGGFNKEVHLVKKVFSGVITKEHKCKI